MDDGKSGRYVAGQPRETNFESPKRRNAERLRTREESHGTSCKPTRSVADVAAGGVPAKRIGRGCQSARSDADNHQTARRLAMENVAALSAGQRRHVPS